MQSKVKLKVTKLEGQGIDIQRVVDGLQNMKSELEALGCKVSINVEGTELEGKPTKAGKETRTPDILLGKNSVMVEGENVATAGPDRSEIIKTYEWLGYVISDHWRGRASDQELKAAYNDYMLACFNIHEPHFILADINSDDMSGIPDGYPHVKPDLPSVADYYNTPKAQARYGKIGANR